MTTPLADILTYLLLSLSTDPNPSDLISKLAVACANHPQSALLLNTFIERFTQERGMLNLEASLRKMEKAFEVEGYGLH